MVLFTVVVLFLNQIKDNSYFFMYYTNIGIEFPEEFSGVGAMGAQPPYRVNKIYGVQGGF